MGEGRWSRPSSEYLDPRARLEYRSAPGTWDTSSWDTPDFGYLWSTNYLGQPGAGLILKIQNSSKTLSFLDKFPENWPEKETITFCRM